VPLPGLAFTKTIVVLDRDLGFIVVMSEVLARAGYAVVPASSLRNARNLIRELRISVDLLIIGYEELLLGLNRRDVCRSSRCQ
jgi:DNA-binding response OmpR family regulator